MAMDTALNEITLDGFQIVSGVMFAHIPRKSDPTCTLWPTSISFNRRTAGLINNCEHIQLRVNAQEKKLLIIPVSSKDKDGIRWIKSLKEPTVRKIECNQFASQLYEVWGLDPKLNYRATGKLCTADNKVLVLFDFGNPEAWIRKKAGSQNE